MGPLEGIKILDMSRLLPGPYCTRLLADMGADVIKVEEPLRGDYSREFTPQREKGMSCWFMEVNRNKRSVTLDLKTPEGVAAFRKLAQEADAVVESYRPGVLTKLKVDYETISALNPKIVYLSLTGYGSDGPLAKQADHDIGYQSLAGIVSMSGEYKGQPAIPGILAADMGAASMAAMSLLAALRYAEKTGVGQKLSVSLYDTALNLMPGVAAAYFYDGTVHERGNNWLTGANLNYNIYRTKDGKYLSVGCLEEKFWRNLCLALDREDWVEKIKCEWNLPIIEAALTVTFESKTLSEWQEILAGKDTCVEPVLNFQEAVRSEQTQVNQMVLKCKDDIGEYEQMGFVPKFSKTPCSVRRRAPRLGEHNKEILGE